MRTFACALVLLLGCGDDDGTTPPVDSGSPLPDAPALDTGPPDAGDVGEMCPPPPADLPELEIVEDGEFRRIDSFPLPGFDPRQVTIYLPAGYDPARRYPVLYFTDGQAVFAAGYRTNEAMEGLVASGAIEPHIIVAIYSLGPSRTAELTPDVDPTMTTKESGRGDEFAGVIVDRVKPFVDAHFSTRCGREHTTIAGFSLGGLMCLHMLMRDPEIFGRGICMSPSFWWNGRSVLDRFDGYDGELPVRAWIDVGTQETWSQELIDELGKEMAVFFEDHPRAIRAGRDLAITKGMVLGRDLGYLELFDGAHTPLDLRRRMTSVLAFVLSATELATETPASAALHVWHDQIHAAPGSITSGLTVSFEARYADPFVLTWPNTGVTFTSSDEAIATIDENGVIEAVAPGMVTITAAAMGLDTMDTLEVLPPM